RIIRARDETIARLEDELVALRERSRQTEALNQLLQAAILRLHDELSESHREFQQAADLNQSLTAKVEGRETLIKARDEAIKSLKHELAELITSNYVVSAELSTKAAELDRITRSLGWRVLNRYGFFKYRYLLHIYRLFRLWPYTRAGVSEDREAEASGNKAPGRVLG